MIYTDNRALAIEIRKLLTECGLELQDIADVYGVSRQQAYHMIMSKVHLSFDDVRRAADACGYELHYSFVKKADAGQSPAEAAREARKKIVRQERLRRLEAKYAATIDYIVPSTHAVIEYKLPAEETLTAAESSEQSDAET